MGSLKIVIRLTNHTYSFRGASGAGLDLLMGFGIPGGVGFIRSSIRENPVNVAMGAQILDPARLGAFSPSFGSVKERKQKSY